MAFGMLFVVVDTASRVYNFKVYQNDNEGNIKQKKNFFFGKKA